MNTKEWKLVDKYGEYIYKFGTKYEVADYCLRNQLLMVNEEDKMNKIDTLVKQLMNKAKEDMIKKYIWTEELFEECYKIHCKKNWSSEERINFIADAISHDTYEYDYFAETPIDEEAEVDYESLAKEMIEIFKDEWD